MLFIKLVSLLGFRYEIAKILAVYIRFGINDILYLFFQFSRMMTTMGLSAMKCNRIINEIENVINNKEKYFEKAGVRERTYNNLAKIIDAKNIRR